MQQRKIRSNNQTYSQDSRVGCFFILGHISTIILTQNMDSDLFLQLMEGYLIAQANAFHENNWVMDNDPKHTSRKVNVWHSHNERYQTRRSHNVQTSTILKIYSDGLSRS